MIDGISDRCRQTFTHKSRDEVFETLGAKLNMTPSEFNFFVNAGLAGVFAIFAIILFDKFIKFLEAQEAKWQAFIAAQTIIWQNFLKEQRDAYNSALGRIAEEVKTNTIMVNSNRVMLERLDTNLDEHMTAVSNAIPEMRDVIKEKKEPTQPFK